MLKHALSVLVAALVAGQVYAAPPARTMYAAALAREQALRPRIAAENAPVTTLKEARAIVAAYEAVVRHYPASGYSDNALWQAGRLSLDAFERFGQLQDREAGVHLLRRLAETYPTSKLARQVSGQISRAEAAASTMPAVNRSSPAENGRAAREKAERTKDERAESAAPPAVNATHTAAPSSAGRAAHQAHAATIAAAHKKIAAVRGERSETSSPKAEPASSPTAGIAATVRTRRAAAKIGARPSSRRHDEHGEHEVL